MLSKNMTKALNEQINKELFSAYLYKQIAIYYKGKHISGFANWFEVQKQEEENHAQLIIDYLQDHGAEVELKAIAAPDQKFEDYLTPLELAYKHEKSITKSVTKIYEQARDEKDYLTEQFMLWFVKEQFEEEQNADELVNFYSYCKDDKMAMLEMERRLGAREFVPVKGIL